MRRINYAAAVIMICWAFATPAVGQNDCLASFQVNRSKSLTHLLIGPNASDRIETTISCPVAEKMRDEFYATGNATDLNLLSNANQVGAKILEIRMRLARDKSQMVETSSEAAHFSSILRGRDTVLAAGIASATIGCMISEDACKPAVKASVVLYDMADSASKVANLAQARAQALKDIGALELMLQTIQDHLNDTIVEQSKQRFDVVLSEMCRAIKEQCK